MPELKHLTPAEKKRKKLYPLQRRLKVIRFYYRERDLGRTIKYARENWGWSRGKTVRVVRTILEAGRLSPEKFISEVDRLERRIRYWKGEIKLQEKGNLKIRFTASIETEGHQTMVVEITSKTVLERWRDSHLTRDADTGEVIAIDWDRIEGVVEDLKEATEKKVKEFFGPRWREEWDMVTGPHDQEIFGKRKTLEGETVLEKISIKHGIEFIKTMETATFPSAEIMMELFHGTEEEPRAEHEYTKSWSVVL